VERYQSLDYDCSLALNQVYETPELPLSFHLEGGPFGDKSYIQGLGDPEIEAAIHQANIALDVEERVARVHDAQRIIYEKDPMFLPLVSPRQHFVYQPEIHNIPSGVGTTAYHLSIAWMDA
jgi:ABC-type transport system substrate-binding protein